MASIKAGIQPRRADVLTWYGQYKPSSGLKATVRRQAECTMLQAGHVMTKWGLAATKLRLGIESC